MGNLSGDPMFAGPGLWGSEADLDVPPTVIEANSVFIDGDYHLLSEAGHLDLFDETWLSDNSTSPAIDAGDPVSDWSAEPVPNGDRINQGAYGGTNQASQSP